ncbi:MAG: hypothetical protein K9K66_10385 [Desulfarculaceae bacterium]|nr:hypothetical protein [Desulfarculaceae bacterium]MCF8073903.1 hypothetical protein [Desulfarculaceae bacterium]MCF8102056.1 hypothetical protein [Desulfarculaceae bacterium]MCF8116327.1 hypothetical protein [Desulfarculaceae bacterium]
MRFYQLKAISLAWLGGWLLPGCLAQPVGRARAPGPVLAGGPVSGSEALWWPWAVGLGIVLGAGLALAAWAWLSRPAPRSPGRWWGSGDTGNLRAALRLVEQVIHDSNHRMKVVPFDKWVAERRRKKDGKGKK